MTTIVPPNTSARITLPFKSEQISVSKGDASFKQAGNESSTQVPAGTYQFTIKR